MGMGTAAGGGETTAGVSGTVCDDGSTVNGPRIGSSRRASAGCGSDNPVNDDGGGVGTSGTAAGTLNSVTGRSPGSGAAALTSADSVAVGRSWLPPVGAVLTLEPPISGAAA